MTLGEPVLDSRGGTLLPAGTALSNSIVNSLQRRGIDTVVVVNNAISENDLRLERERLGKRLDSLFRGCKDGPASEALMKGILGYRLGADQ